MKHILLVSVLLFVSTQVANAQSLITIVRGQDFPPYHFMDESGHETGFIIEVIQAVAEDINIGIKFKQYPWSRCLRMVESGNADAMMNLFKTAERERFMHFSNNILAYEINQFFKLNNTSLTYDGDLGALSSLKIGAIRNYSYGPVFDSAKLDNIYRLETETSLIKALLGKRCHLIIGNNRVIEMLVKQMGVENGVAPLFPVVSKEPLYLGFSKKKNHGGLSETFSRALGKLKRSNAYEKILKKFN
ncbi:MAG: transporter substrate-binding domain-containing protein [Desulfobacter sp.]|nr:MAG: transporter substrate-binding domain-containing protein [Desulfobacter sp.]